MSRHNAKPLIVHVIYALSTGGLENGLVNILNRFPDRYRHMIICLTTADSFAERITNSQVELIQMRKRPGHDVGMYWRLLRILWRLRPDILHTRNLAALEIQALGILLPGTRRIHGEHGRDMFDLDGGNRKYIRFRKFMKLIVNHYITVSRDLESWLRETIGVPVRRISQVYNGVDVEKFSPTGEAMSFPEGFLPTGEAPVVIGTVGRLVEVKAQELILRAIGILLGNQPHLRPRLRCVIVGEGPMRADLENKLEHLGLSDVVWLAGEQYDIPAFLQIMDIFVLPSLGEGISNTILEAMATGLPVIASDVGGNPELVEQDKTGFRFPVGDDKELARALGILVENPGLRQNMGRAARERVLQNFDWNRTVAAYLAVYDQVLGSAGTSPARFNRHNDKGSANQAETN